MTFFLSYSQGDQELVDRISRELIAKNVKVWKDRWRLAPGQALDATILEAIRTCSYYCVVLSRQSVRSEWVAKELAAAVASESAGREGFLLPVLVEDCEVPAALENVLAIDLRSDIEGGIRRILEVVGRKYNTNYSGSLDDERDYLSHWVARTVELEGAVRFELDLVAIDLETSYSVLAQVTIESSHVPRSTPGAADEDEDEAAGDRFMRRLVAQYPERNHWLKLLGTDVFERTYEMDAFDDEPEAVMWIRAVRLGSVPANTQLFPLFRYLVQVCRTRGIDVSHVSR